MFTFFDLYFIQTFKLKKTSKIKLFIFYSQISDFCYSLLEDKEVVKNKQLKSMMIQLLGVSIKKSVLIFLSLLKHISFFLLLIFLYAFYIIK